MRGSGGWAGVFIFLKEVLAFKINFKKSHFDHQGGGGLLKLHSFGRIQIRICDPRSLNHGASKEWNFLYIGLAIQLVTMTESVKNNLNGWQKSKKSL